MRELKDKVAAVTGAASGIGRGLAINFALEGCNVALCDVNEEGLKETVGMIGDSVKVTSQIVDVADRGQMQEWAEQVVADHGGVNIVVNNAGVAVADSLEDVSYDDFEWLMGINFWGVVYGSKAFLPYLKKETWGHIVNISSVNGFVANPGNGPYVCAKHAVKGFNETLKQELRSSTVGVSSVHPGGIKTNIARNARWRKAMAGGMSQEEAAEMFDKIARTTPDKAAKIIIRAVKKNKYRVLVGFDAHIIDWMTRHLPALFPRMVGWLLRERTTV